MPGITLDQYAQIMQFPPALFMGVKVANLTFPADPQDFAANTRTKVCQALRDATDMMQAQLTQWGDHAVLFDAQESLESLAPYFDMSGFQPLVVTTKDYAATVTYPNPRGTPRYNDMATVTATIDALDPAVCERFLDAEVVFETCDPLRLGVAWCSGPTLAGVTLTATTRAWNLIDLENITDDVADDGVPYLTRITLRVRTAIPAQPLVHWPLPCGCESAPAVDCVDPCCTDQTTAGCLQVLRGQIYEVKHFTAPCGMDCSDALRYTLQVQRLGLWRPYWSDSLVSLANCLITNDLFGPTPFSNQRWRDDNGEGAKWNGTYRYSYWNPFGIAAPGAQKAWKQIQVVLPGGSAWAG